jgi:hypothetical protein
MRSAIVARVRDRNPIEVANDLGHRFWRLLPYGRRCGNRFVYVARAVAARNALLVELGFKGGSITMIRSRWFLIPFLLSVLLADTGMSQDQAVAVSAGRDGTAQITLANGEKITIQKEPGQVGISESHVGPDGTVGWLAEYKVEGVSYPIAGTLIIWRAGKTIRRFPTEQSFYSWTFYAQGKQVAYHVGPLHGELKSHCELHDATSGRLIAAWDGDLESESNRPAWTKGLSH